MKLDTTNFDLKLLLKGMTLLEDHIEHAPTNSPDKLDLQRIKNMKREISLLLKPMNKRCRY